MKLAVHYNYYFYIYYVFFLVSSSTSHCGCVTAAFSSTSRIGSNRRPSGEISFQRLQRLPKTTTTTTTSIATISPLSTTTVSEEIATEQQFTASTSSNSKSKTYLDDGFVFGLEGSGIERPKGKVAQIVVEGDSLETKPWQVAVVTGTLLFHLGLAASSIGQMYVINHGSMLPTILQAALLFLSSYVLADFGSGVLHWSVDNYGNGRTPIMGGIIAAFQGHHSAPWTITERGFANNVYKLCIPFGIVPMGLINAWTGPHTTLFMTVFCVLEIMSQEFHKWSHMTKGECPPWVNRLQAWGWTIARKPHAQHHLAPYEGNYCIISGICNKALDESGFFRRLEHIVYKWNGVKSNAWKLDAALEERTLRGDYSLPSKRIQYNL